MDKVERFYNIVDENNLTVDDILNLFLNYHGTQLITEEFIEFIGDEGYYVD